MAAATELMKIEAIDPVCLGCAMLQTERWKEQIELSYLDRVRCVFKTPLFASRGRVWGVDDG